jgi:hypothetical protein
MLSSRHMKPVIFLAVLIAGLSACISAAEPKGTPLRKIKTPPEKSIEVIEYVGEDVAEILRKLAAMVGLDAVIAPNVTGSLTLRMRDKTPREAIQIVGRAQGLIVEELDGMLFARPPHPEVATAHRIARSKRLLYNALVAEGFTKEEALRIIISAPDLNLPQLGK